MGKIIYETKQGRTKTIYFNSDAECRDCKTKVNEIDFCKWDLIKRYYVCKNCKNKNIRNSFKYKSERLTNTVKKIYPLLLARKATNLIQDAIGRGIKIEFSYAEVCEIMLGDCNYCGKKSIDKNWNSLDRVDSDLNYTIDNVVSCCKLCNMGKHTKTQQEYIDHCKAVVKHNGGL